MNIFERIVCGIDGTSESDAALIQAVRLGTTETHLTLVHAFSMSPISEIELMLGETWADEEARARQMLGKARSWAIESSGLDPGNVEIRVVPGPKAKGLLEIAADVSATLLCVGSHGRSRLGGAMRGSVASNALHSAPSSVLISRAVSAPDAAMQATAGLIRTIVCAVDGSNNAEQAAEVARELGERLGSTVHYVAAEDGRDVAFAEAARQASTPGELEIESGTPIDVLRAASATADLLIAGSRGLGGTRALGSVSERIAHEADCSVLVVRPS